MPRPFQHSLVALLAALAVSAESASALPSPVAAKQSATGGTRLAFTGYVVDQAGVLNPEERQRLTGRLSRLQHDTGHQFAVVTVTSLGGEDVGAFTTRLANRWGVGRKGLNDGVLLLVAPRDRRARIAVGYGLERRLPDAFCQEVMNQRMVPAFAQGKFGLGIEAGVSEIIARLAATEGRDH